jgi:hypothetical protein
MTFTDDAIMVHAAALARRLTASLFAECKA